MRYFNLLLIIFSVVITVSCDKYRVVADNEVVLYVRPNSSYSDLSDSLRHLLTKSEPFLRYADSYNLKDKFRPGRYKIPAGSKSNYIANMLSNGWQEPLKLVLSGNIRGKERLAAKLGERLGYDSLAFINYFNTPGVSDSYGFDSLNFISMIIPNTYEVYWDITPDKFLDRMKREYDKFWNQEREDKAAEIGLSKTEVSILASIVCEESNYAPELPDIAGVYINRLKRGMKLDADPTVKFALNDPSIKRILFAHLTIDSPYNTYRYEGLPPGPITIPSIRGIDAVLNYTQHNYLYFCASDKFDGTHLFATNLIAHNRNAAAYQRALMQLPKENR